ETTRLRKPRFSFEENQILIREVRAHYPQLYGAQSRRVSVAERRRVWDGIAAKINGITSWKRTGQEVQKRWNDFKRRTKEKLARVPHSTQGAGPTAEDAFSAYVLSEDRREDRRAVQSRGSSTRGTMPGCQSQLCCSAVSSQCTEAREAQQPGLKLGNPAILVGESPQGSSTPLLSQPPTSPGPPPAPRPPPTPSAPDPSLDFLRAQQETAHAIRELAGTLRQGLAKLSEALSALLPLLPGTPVDPLPPPQPPSPPPRPVPPPPAPKVEVSAEPVSVVAAVVDGAVVATRGVIIPPRSEEGVPRPPQPPLPVHDSPPHKRRKGFPTRKRRGRWKSP
ncbi:Myb-related transcription factor, partner of profilin, partial [Heterocephalus glaber]